MTKSTTEQLTDNSTGMSYLDSLPRRVVTVFLPLLIFVFVLLFPFYWMAITTFKSNEELYNFRDFSPFWVVNATLANVEKLFFETSYPTWLWNTMLVSTVATFLSLFCAVGAAYAIERLRFTGARAVGLAIFLAYLVPPSILFIPLATMVFSYGLFDTSWALILTYPTFLIPFCTWLLIGYFKSIPYELEECALIDGASRLQILRQITLTNTSDLQFATIISGATASTVAVSRWLVGSSRSKMSARERWSRANATRLRCPPLMVSTGASRSSPPASAAARRRRCSQSQPPSPSISSISRSAAGSTSAAACS